MTSVVQPAMHKRVGKRDAAQPEVPVEYKTACLIGGKTPEAVPADLLDA